MSSKILITGVAGFIGSNMCDFLLKKNYEIVLNQLFNDRGVCITDGLQKLPGCLPVAIGSFHWKNIKNTRNDTRSLENCMNM